MLHVSYHVSPQFMHNVRLRTEVHIDYFFKTVVCCLSGCALPYLCEKGYVELLEALCNLEEYTPKFLG